MSKPKLKLSEKEALALFAFYHQQIIDVYFMNDRVEKIIIYHIGRIYEKLQKKIRNRYYIRKFDITLLHVEANAWIEYWEMRQIPVGYQYEELFIQRTINELNKLYA